MNTVYLVDDDRFNLNQLLNRRNVFLECGFEIAGFETDPLKALEEIRDIRPDAVLSDLKMPGLDGVGLLGELQRDAEPPVFVIISAYNELSDVRKVFKKHGFDYLIKPVTNMALMDLLGEVRDKIEKLPPTLVIETPSEELNQILIFLKAYPAMSHTLEATAERYGLNPKAVCKLFSKHLNTTFIAFLTRLRMEKAEKLLGSTDLLVKKIAAQCGYPDHFYFTRVFTKTHDGMTPTDYRAGRSADAELLAHVTGAGRSADAELPAHATGEAARCEK